MCGVRPEIQFSCKTFFHDFSSVWLHYPILNSTIFGQPIVVFVFCFPGNRHTK